MADVARRASCATIFVLSKWDIAQLELEDVRERLHIKARQRPPIVVTSALTKRGLERLVRVIDDVYDRYVSRIGTGEFNRLLRDILATREAPLVQGAAAQDLLRRAGAGAAAALPPDGQRPQPRHARLRVLARESAARGAGAAGRARDPGPGRALRGAGARRRRRLVGHGVRRRAGARRAPGRARLPRSPRRRRADREAREHALPAGHPHRGRASSPCCSISLARRRRPS